MTEPARFQLTIRDLIVFTISFSLLAAYIRLAENPYAPLFAITVIIYGTKFFLNRRNSPVRPAVLIYLMVVGISLACFGVKYADGGFLPVTAFVALLILPIPTGFLARDLWAGHPSRREFVRRSTFIEMLALVPLWCVLVFAVLMGFAH